MSDPHHHHEPLKPGDLVYRVVEIEPPVEGRDLLYTWKSQAVAVEKASERQIKLRTNFYGMGRKLFTPDAYGRVFFATPRLAILHFVAERKLEIESLDRKRADAVRAIEWAAWALS